ncbi:MAG TPA: hypothetical protein PLX35_10440 [Cyclobacteriaceae bacterium]|nr:hypothetical protein [Cyclobacteriaceae bacterium]
MRLGQLARKLALRTSDLVTFLNQHQITIDSGNNTRLEDSHVKMIIHHFAPDLSEEKITEALVEPDPVEPEVPPAVINTIDSSTEPPAEIITALPETIKAPKIELAGLKVLGKIELPEPKKKEPKPETEPQPEVPRKTFNNRRDRQASAPRKNPISIQREQEKREAEAKRQLELEKLKEKKALHYQRKVKAQPPIKRVRLVDEPVEEFSAQELKEPPKTWMGKFLRWLNT